MPRAGCRSCPRRSGPGRSPGRSGAGLLGLAQFGLGGAIGPLVSLSGVTTVRMAATVAATAGAALLIRQAIARVTAASAWAAEPVPPDVTTTGLGGSAFRSRAPNKRGCEGHADVPVS